MSAVRKLTADVITYKKSVMCTPYRKEEKKPVMPPPLMYTFIYTYITHMYSVLCTLYISTFIFFPICLETENKNWLIDSSMVYNSLLVLVHTIHLFVVIGMFLLPSPCFFFS